MNLAIFSNFYPPKTGGSSHYAHDLAVEMTKHGHQVIVITANLDGFKASSTHEDGVVVYRLPSLQWPSLGISHGFDLRWTFLPNNFGMIGMLLSHHGIDALHCCGQFMDLVVPAAFWSWFLGIPSVLSIHTRVEHTDKFYDSVLSFLDKTVVRFLVSAFRVVIALDKPCEQYIDARYRPSLVMPIVTGVRIPKRVGGHKERLILSVSHVTKLKSPESLIRAMPYVLKEFPRAKLAIVGKVCEPSVYDLVDGLRLRDSVKFYGNVPYKDVEKLYARAMIEAHDLGLGLGIGSSALEAMGSGLCVLSAAEPDNFWKISPRPAHEIFYVQKDDSRHIADMIRFALWKGTAKRIGMNARKYVLKHFAWERIGNQFNQLYTSLVNAKRCP